MSDADLTLPPFLLETQFMQRVWGGQRLSSTGPLIGEAWGAYDGNRIIGGPLDGLTLEEACSRHPVPLLGASVVERFGARFPLLTKLLDTRDWLSVQVHPDDALARQFEGPGQMGKTEAWHILEASPNAEIILGFQPGTSRTDIKHAVRTGKVLDIVACPQIATGETWLIPAGTIHALGPGLFLYEVQQASDITYRVYDWDRPATAGRALHIEESIACLSPDAGERRSAAESLGNRRSRLVSCDYFALDQVRLSSRELSPIDTNADSFHAVTVVDGSIQVAADSGTIEAGKFETAIVPASIGRYEVRGSDAAVVMIAYVPPQ